MLRLNLGNHLLFLNIINILIKTNVTSTTFSQQILGDKLLIVVTGRNKNNFIGRFNLKAHNNLPLKIYCENIVDVVLLY